MHKTLEWATVLKELRTQFTECGYDIVAPFNVEWYNAVISREDLHLPTSTIFPGKTFGVLVGNNRRLWDEGFSVAVSQRKFPPAWTDTFEWDQTQNPFDTYVMQTVPRAVERAISSFCDCIDIKDVVFRYAHETAPGRLVAVQRLGEAASVGVVDESSHLCIHPTYGPWFAFRSVILFPMIKGLSDSDRQPAPRLDDLVTPQEQRLARRRLQIALESKKRTDWIAVRESIEFGKKHRYGQDQLLYHYTKDQSILSRLTSDTSVGDRVGGGLK